MVNEGKKVVKKRKKNWRKKFEKRRKKVEKRKNNGCKKAGIVGGKIFLAGKWDKSDSEQKQNGIVEKKS